MTHASAGARTHRHINDIQTHRNGIHGKRDSAIARGRKRVRALVCVRERVLLSIFLSACLVYTCAFVHVHVRV